VPVYKRTFKVFLCPETIGRQKKKEELWKK